VLTVRVALMRVARRAVLAERRRSRTQAVASLIQHHRIADGQVPHLGTSGLDDARHFMTEHLARDVERTRTPKANRWVVCRAFEDVEVRAAQPDAADTHDNVTRPDDRIGHFADGHHAGCRQDGRLHRTPLGGMGNSRTSELDNFTTTANVRDIAAAIFEALRQWVTS